MKTKNVIPHRRPFSIQDYSTLRKISSLLKKIGDLYSISILAGTTEQKQNGCAPKKGNSCIYLFHDSPTKICFIVKFSAAKVCGLVCYITQVPFLSTRSDFSIFFYPERYFYAQKYIYIWITISFLGFHFCKPPLK